MVLAGGVCDPASADGARVLHRQPVVVTAYTEGGEELTGPQARQFAAALLNAADAWDEVPPRST